MISKEGLAIDIFDWVLDTEASYHMTSYLYALTALFDLAQPIYITLPDGKIVKVWQAGTVNLRHGLVLKNVIYSSEFECNLISVM